MSTQSGLKRATKYFLVIAVVTVCAGCPHDYKSGAGRSAKENTLLHDYDPHYPHNLARVKCRKDTDKKDVKIEVAATKDVLLQPFDYVVFVCKGERVYWHSTDGSLQIAVTFTDPALSKTLFGSGDTNILSSSSSGENQTAKEIVDTLERHAHEYSIVVTDRQGKKFSVDPHVIPMGN
jgi:hypothetical protein